MDVVSLFLRLADDVCLGSSHSNCSRVCSVACTSHRRTCTCIQTSLRPHRVRDAFPRSGSTCCSRECPRSPSRVHTTCSSTLSSCKVNNRLWGFEAFDHPIPLRLSFSLILCSLIILRVSFDIRVLRVGSIQDLNQSPQQRIEVRSMLSSK